MVMVGRHLVQPAAHHGIKQGADVVLIHTKPALRGLDLEVGWRWTACVHLIPAQETFACTNLVTVLKTRRQIQCTSLAALMPFSVAASCNYA